MSAVIRQLLDNENTAVYPVTRAEAVYLGTNDTVERFINDSRDANTDITFGVNKITKKMASGSTSVTSFEGNVINEVTTNKDGAIVQTKVTTFNADGSIKIEVR